MIRLCSKVRGEAEDRDEVEGEEAGRGNHS